MGFTSGMEWCTPFWSSVLFQFPILFWRKNCRISKLSKPTILYKHELIYHSFKHSQTNTFQAIIITDVFTTYVIYTYKCGELEWSGPDFLHAVVGYNLPNVGFMNEPLSRTPAKLSIACENHPISNFVNIVYQFQANSGKIL